MNAGEIQAADMLRLSSRISLKDSLSLTNKSNKSSNPSTRTRLSADVDD
jgi:hypothetical protein